LLFILKNLSKMKIQIINGPNLNLLGTREPNVYGSSSFNDYLSELKALFPTIQIDYFQSNIEGELIDKIQEAGFSCNGIILNAGGYTHTSVAIRDAIKAVSSPVVEVHISNVHAREEFRRQSMISAVCVGVIAGFGMDSYRLAVESLIMS
jgi:3-dehydroquinate dehydratase-2